MNSLYQALLVQHARQLTPDRCAEQTIAQLHRILEDVVLENNLAALVIESLPLATERSLRDLARVREVGRAAQRAFYFVSADDALNSLPLRMNEQEREPILLKRSEHDTQDERFVVIADARFSAILASIKRPGEEGVESGDEVIWSFEPDIVYSALEYLMARVTAERSFQATTFSLAVKSSMPKATSLQLTVSVTTKLARLLQEQTAREIAINRVATAIRNTLDLDNILQTTVVEVGRALGARDCGLRILAENGSEMATNCYYRDSAEAEASQENDLICDLNAYSARIGGRFKNYVLDGRVNTDLQMQSIHPLAAIPLMLRERSKGTLLVRSDDPSRVWQESELLLLRTVADQVTIAVDHAQLFAQTEQQALTDPLTGCVNRRSFEMQLEKDIHNVTRTRQPLSLIMLDVDQFKGLNDTYGHDAGDTMLRMIADALREELRGVDTASRYAGEAFAVILPHADIEGAMVVAERLRARIESIVVRGAGSVTASFGVATFPQHARARERLVEFAEKALVDAKQSGRNRVCGPPANLELPSDTHDASLFNREGASASSSDNSGDSVECIHLDVVN